MTAVLQELSVGAELPPLAIPPISRTTLALFAGASNDHNPIHIDSDVAHSAGLDDVFAHGMLSMAYLARFVTSTARQWDLRSFRVRFAAITPLHGRPTCTGRVAAIEERGGERQADLDLTVTLADGTVTLRGTATVTLRGTATVTLRGTATVTLRGTATVTLRGTATVALHNDQGDLP